MKTFNLIVTTIVFVFCISGIGFAQTIQVAADAPEGQRLPGALAFANGGNADVIELVTDGGIYEMHTGDSINVAMTIRAADGLTDKPIIRAAVGDTVDAFFRIRAPFTVEGVIFDGMRGDGTLNPFPGQNMMIGNDSMRDGTFPRHNFIVRNCEFRNAYRNADPEFDTKGNIIRAKTNAICDTIMIEDCLFENNNDEAIVYQNAAKEGPTGTGNERVANYIVIRNCTFMNVGVGSNNQGIITIKGDDDTTTVDAKILIENLTFYDAGPKAVYSRESPDMVMRNIIVANTSTGDDDFLLRLDRNGSVISHVDTFMIGELSGDALRAGPGQNTDAGMATLDSATIYNFDPMFADPENGDLTLMAGSPLYTLAHDGGALGDRRWATNPPTSVAETEQRPDIYGLSQNYPNPFNPTTNIQFTLKEPGFTTLKIYNVLGHEVATLVERRLEAKSYDFAFNAANLPSGVYFYSIDSGSFVMVKKMLLMK